MITSRGMPVENNTSRYLKMISMSLSLTVQEDTFSKEWRRQRQEISLRVIGPINQGISQQDIRSSWVTGKACLLKVVADSKKLISLLKNMFKMVIISQTLSFLGLLHTNRRNSIGGSKTLLTVLTKLLILEQGNLNFIAQRTFKFFKRFKTLIKEKFTNRLSSWNTKKSWKENMHVIKK